VLAARGVRGVLVAPLPPGVETIDLDWERFAAASVGYSMARPRLHLAANHQAHTVDLAVARLRAAGRRRIGLAVPEGDDRRVDHHWHSWFLWHHAQWPRAERVPVLGIGAWGEAAFRAWYARHRPDALLVVSGRPAGWLRGLGARATRRTPVAYLDWWPARAPAPGVDQHSAEVGAAAVDLVVGQLHRNESGPPPHPKTVLVEGVWRDPAAPA
jgi:LacI family transcriptional regulator